MSTTATRQMRFIGGPLDGMAVDAEGASFGFQVLLPAAPASLEQRSQTRASQRRLSIYHRRSEYVEVHRQRVIACCAYEFVGYQPGGAAPTSLARQYFTRLGRSIRKSAARRRDRLWTWMLAPVRFPLQTHDARPNSARVRSGR